MKKIILSVVCLLGLVSLADAAPTRTFRFYFLNRRAACILLQQIAPPQAQSDPALLAAVNRIADQQAALNLQFQLQAAQQRPVTSDPAVLAGLQRIADQQDRLLDAIREGRVSDAQTQALLRELISAQTALLTAVNTRPNPPTPPVVVVPPTFPPASGGGGGLLTIPSAGGPLQVIPGAGGSLQVLPPAGGSIQAVPGPGGSIQLLPGGVKPPDGGTTPPPPGGGIIIPLPGIGSPMTPLPGSGAPIPSFKYRTTYPTRR